MKHKKVHHMKPSHVSDSQPSHPFLKFNQHQLLATKIKAMNHNLPYLQAHHLGKSQTV